MRESDQDGDGKLDYKEFKTIIKVIYPEFILF